MSATSIIFFLFGVVVLWGGLATTLTNANQRQKEIVSSPGPPRGFLCLYMAIKDKTVV